MAILDRFRKKQSDETPKADEQKAKKPANPAKRDPGTRGKAAASDTKTKKPAKKAEAVKKEQKKEEKTQETIVGKISTGDLLSQRLLLKPHVSEKAARLADKNVYVFDVRTDAEKIAVKKAVEAMYGVNVKKVRMIRGIGKPVRRGRKVSRRKDWKKALVEVKKGQTIDLYEGV